ncbi:MAG: hypothetical protein L3J22_03960 [Xanthomonadales bacterium]|nr:hypothetical protein [Xanthomonadales bacterium]
MFNKIFPQTIDNTLNGRWLGFWLLIPVLLFKIMIAIGSILVPAAANSTDGIDMSTYPAAALQEALVATSLLGLLHLAIGLMCVLAMIRYRAMIPLIYVWLLLEFAGRRVLLNIYAIERSGDASTAVIMNSVLLALMLVGFIFSVTPRKQKIA